MKPLVASFGIFVCLCGIGSGYQAKKPDETKPAPAKGQVPAPQAPKPEPVKSEPAKAEQSRDNRLGRAAGVERGAFSGRRMALVLANSNYKNLHTLPNAINDAKEVADALKERGFNVTGPLVDLDLKATKDAVKNFALRVQKSDAALVYYAGHGVHARDRNYILPVDFEMDEEMYLDQSAYRLDYIVEHLRAASVSARALIVDACRNNPYKGGAEYNPIRDDANMSGTLYAYAASLGQAARDGRPGSNGVFTGHLISALRTAQIGLLYHALQTAARLTTEEMGSEQVPLVGDGPAGAVQLKEISRRSAEGVSPELLDAVREYDHWTAIRANLNVERCQEFLERWPKSSYREPCERLMRTSGYSGAKITESDIVPKPLISNMDQPVQSESRWFRIADGTPVLRFLPKIDQMSEQQVDRYYRDLRDRLGWKELTGVAKEWWEAFEAGNATNKATVALLAQELDARDATITEFFLAYVYSDVDKVDENLAYMDLKRAESAKEPPFVRAFKHSSLDFNFTAIAKALPPGPKEEFARKWLQQLIGTNVKTPGRVLWLIEEARRHNATMTEIYEAATDSDNMLHWVQNMLYRRFPAKAVQEHIAKECETAKQLVEREAHQEAITLLTSSIEAGKAANCTYFFRAIARSRVGRTLDALSDYEEALRLDPEDWASLNNVGSQVFEMGRLKQARERMGKVAEQRKDVVLYQTNVAEAALALGDWNDLEKWTDRALELDASEPLPLYMRAAAYLLRGEKEEAEKHVRLADGLKSRSGAGHLIMAWAYALAGDSRSALRHCSESAKLKYSGNPGDRYYWGLAHFSAGDYANARLDFDAELQSHPLSGFAYFLRSHTRKALGDEAGALLDMDRSLQLGVEISDVFTPLLQEHAKRLEALKAKRAAR